MQKLYSCRFCHEPGDTNCKSCNGYGGKRKKAPRRQKNGVVIYLTPKPRIYQLIAMAK